MAIRNFLVVFNWRESKLDHWRDLDRELRDGETSAQEAQELYRQYEARFKPDDGYEVVMIGADSIETVRQTHGHYFGKIAIDPFAELLGD